MTEVELKLALDAAAAPRLRRALDGGARRQHLISIYFDTADGVLAKNAMALRLRRSGKRWTQCLKAGASGAGGMHQRDEWEHGRPGPSLDLSLLAHTPLAAVEGADALHTALVPVFEVDVTRTTWNAEPKPGERLEVAWDRGKIRSGGREDAISEVEIECVEAPRSAAYALAERLLEDVAMRPSPVTKAERGYRLFRGKGLRPAKAKRARLEASMSPTAAARALVGAGLAQLQANEEGVLVCGDPEFVHQARVAMRRMRSALRLFRRPIRPKRAKAWRDALRETARALGEARDWDVFALETLPPLARTAATRIQAKRIVAAAEASRLQAREAARAAFRSPDYARTMLEISRWLGEDGLVQADETLAAFAARLLAKRHKRLQRDCSRLARLDRAGRHRLRIDAKRLRYVADCLGGVFGAHRVDPYIEALVDMQDTLGKANDAATAIRLLESLETPQRFRATARRRLAARMRPASRRLEAIAGRIAHHGSFWDEVRQGHTGGKHRRAND